MIRGKLDLTLSLPRGLPLTSKSTNGEFVWVIDQV